MKNPSCAVLFLFSSPCPLALGLDGQPPLAVDDAYSTIQGDNLSVDAPGVLANDSDPEGNDLIPMVVSQAGSFGTLLLFDDGSFEYETAPGFVGVDTFQYVVSDGTSVSAPATIEFTVDSDGGGGGSQTFIELATFLDAANGLGIALETESFEESVWPRTPATAASVSNQGLVWSANNPTSGITTGSGPAIVGDYGFFQLPHGDYLTGTGCTQPGACTDGWIVQADSGKFVAAGLYIHCNAGTAGIEFLLDGDAANPIDFENSALPAGSTRFFGVIEPAGFTTLEIHETEGKLEEAAFIFSDFFRFELVEQAEVLPYGCGVNPVDSLVLASGSPRIGTTIELHVDNPLGTQGPGSIPLLGLSASPALGFPCGLLLPGFGMAGSGASGELLLGTSPIPVILVGTPWASSNLPGVVLLTLPAKPAWIGLSLFAQGILLDPNLAAPVPVGLAGAFEFVLGS